MTHSFTADLDVLMAGRALRRSRRAARRRRYRATGPCACVGCTEAEQLREAAQWHPQVEVRALAAAFLDAMNRVIAGRAGAIGLGNCFD